MKSSLTLKILLPMMSLFLAHAATAQQSTDDAADVILAIEEQWQAVQNGDDDWIDDKLHDRFSAWPNESPAPRSKLSTRKWTRFFATQGRLVEHELYFQNIVVDGDVAVAHYFYTSANEDNDGELEVTNGRYTDVLVRTDDGWKFLAWHGGETD
jgi:ketosteroid isomerase-like protein